MSILSDDQIRDLALEGMIEPFYGSLVRKLVYSDGQGIDRERSVISYGTSSYGYDIRLSDQDFRVFRHLPGQIVDPKDFDRNHLEGVPINYHWDDNVGAYYILPGHTYALGVAKEKLRVPRGITVICLGKSTYARCGVIVNMTPAESGWEGYLTLELSNSSDSDCRIYANEGIAQLLFFEGEECCISYADRGGKYQYQKEEVTLPLV
jgi:dCTP deaminase